MKNKKSSSLPPLENNYIIYTLNSIIEQTKFIFLNKNDYFENLCLNEITGESGSGKTQLCLFIILKTILPKKLNCLESSCLYISTTKKLPTVRLSDLFNYYSKDLSENEKKFCLSNLFEKHLNYDEFEKFISIDIESFIQRNNIQTIIIDSITGICDIQFINEKNETNFRERTKFLKLCVTSFKRLILKYNLFFFCVNNVLSDFNNINSNDNNNNNKGNSIKPCLGKYWENSVNNRFLLQMKENQNEKIRYINVHFSKNYEPMYKIRFEIKKDQIIFYDNQ